MNVRVILVDDLKITLDGLRTLLENEVDITVIGEAENGRTAVELVGALHPDVVVMDVAMPELNGIGDSPNTDCGPPERIIPRAPHTSPVEADGEKIFVYTPKCRTRLAIKCAY